MKNYIYTKSSVLIAADAENSTEYSLVSSIYANTDWMYLIPEDGTFIFEKEKYDVKKGDIVFIMYPIIPEKKGYEREVIIVSNEKLYDHYKRYQDREEAEDCGPCEACTPCKRKCCCDSELVDQEASEPDTEDPQTEA